MAKAADIAAAAESDQEFYQAKLATARFYAANLLPQTAAFAHAAKAGSDDIMALAETTF